jgi:hypothetical protein
MKGVLAITEIPLVSVDFRCTDVSTTIDAALTMVMGDDMVKVVAWYDNEWGYTQRVVDLCHIVAAGLVSEGVVMMDPMDEFCSGKAVTGAYTRPLLSSTRAVFVIDLTDRHGASHKTCLS